jgi:hypothetical protein
VAGKALRLSGMSVLLVVSIVFAGLVASALCAFGRDADLGFYSATSQVIPVFLIALVVELSFRLPGYSSAVARLGDLEAQVGAIRERARVLLAEIRQNRQGTENMGSENTGSENTGSETEGTLTERVENLERSARENLEKAEAHDEILTRQRSMLAGLSDQMRGLVVAFLVVAALGEGTSLYALGAKTSTTFLLTVTVASLAGIVLLFGAVVLMRYRV